MATDRNRDVHKSIRRRISDLFSSGSTIGLSNNYTVYSEPQLRQVQSGALTPVRPSVFLIDRSLRPARPALPMIVLETDFEKRPHELGNTKGRKFTAWVHVFGRQRAEESMLAAFLQDNFHPLKIYDYGDPDSPVERETARLADALDIQQFSGWQSLDELPQEGSLNLWSVVSTVGTVKDRASIGTARDRNRNIHKSLARRVRDLFTSGSTIGLTNNYTVYGEQDLRNVQKGTLTPVRPSVFVVDRAVRPVRAALPMVVVEDEAIKHPLEIGTHAGRSFRVNLHVFGRQRSEESLLAAFLQENLYPLTIYDYANPDSPVSLETALLSDTITVERWRGSEGRDQALNTLRHEGAQVNWTRLEVQGWIRDVAVAVAPPVVITCNGTQFIFSCDENSGHLLTSGLL